MKNFLFFFLSLFIIVAPARAEFALGIGTGITTQYETRETAANGRELLDFGSGTFGLGLDAEWMRDSRLSISLAGVVRRENATTQYSKNSISVPNLNTNATTTAFAIGPRFRFVNWKHLRVFLGAGLGAGYLSLDYSRSDYVLTNGSDAGLRDEGHAFGGYYYEGGVELYITQRSALRLIGRHTTYQTKKFETIGNKNLNIDLTQFTLQFMFFI